MISGEEIHAASLYCPFNPVFTKRGKKRNKPLLREDPKLAKSLQTRPDKLLLKNHKILCYQVSRSKGEVVWVLKRFLRRMKKSKEKNEKRKEKEKRKAKKAKKRKRKRKRKRKTKGERKRKRGAWMRVSSVELPSLRPP